MFQVFLSEQCLEEISKIFLFTHNSAYFAQMSPRWPDGSIVGLGPEEDEDGEDDVETDEEPEEPRRRGPKPKQSAKCKSKPKGRDKKDSKASDNGRAVNTEYYHHATYSQMPDPNLIIRSTDYRYLSFLHRLTNQIVTPN